MILYKNISIYYLSSFVGKFLQFFLIILISKKISAIAFGYYSFALNLISILCLISLIGIPQFLTLKISSLKNNDKKFFIILNYLANTSIFCGILFIISAIFIYFYYKNIFIGGNISFLWFFLFGYILILFTINNAVLSGLEKTSQVSISDSVIKNILLIFFIFFFSDYTVNGIFKSYFISIFIVFFIMIVFTLRNFKSNFNNISKVQYFSFTFLDKNNRKLLAATGMVEAVSIFFSFTPIFLTEKLLVIEKLGIYNFAYLISSSALILVNSISASSFPMISRLRSENKTGEILQLIISLRFLNTLFIFIFIPAFFLIYKYFLYFFGNSLHNDSTNYIFFFLLCHLILSFFSLNTNLLFIFNYQKKIIRNYLISILIVSPFFLYLIINYGVTGSVLVYFCLSITFAIINEVTVRKIFKKSIFFDIFLIKKNFIFLKKIFKFYFSNPLKK